MFWMPVKQTLPGDAGAHPPVRESFITDLYGRQETGLPAPNGTAVGSVRKPNIPANPDTVAVHAVYGRRIGFLSREVAADYAALIDVGLVRLSGRLVAPGEPDYGAGQPMTNLPLIVGIHADIGRLDAFLAQRAAG